MKLHLPKLLLTAVLAAVAMAPAAWGTSDTTANSGWDKILDGSNTVAEDSYGVGDATITSVDTADSESPNTTLFIRSNAGVSNATIGTLTISEGDTAKIDGWYDSDENHPEFALLTINTLNFGNNSSLSVLKDNTVQVNAYSGTFKGEVTGTLKLNLGSGKSVSFDKEESNVLTGDGTIEVMSGTLKMSNQSGGTSSVAGTIKVAGGATLSLDTGDALGYNANATDAVILKGTSAESMATMQMTGSDVDNDGRQTLTTAITMQGHARITGGSLESLGNIGSSGGGANTLTVTGTNNEISSVVYLRSDLIVNVTGESDSLEISGNIGKRTTEGTGIFTKSGAGTLTLSGTNTFKGELKVNAGQLDISGLTTANKLVTVTSTGVLTTKGSGRVAFNDGLSLSGSMTIESGSSVSLAGNSILNKAITNNGMLELDGVIDISSLEGTTTSTFDDPDKNGFETISANYKVVTGTGVSNVTTTESLQWKIGTNLMQGTLNSGTLSIADSKGTTYYVSKGNINRAALITNTAASGVKEDTLFALNGGVLQLSAGETMNGSQVIVTDEGGTSTISLADTSILTNGSSLLSKVTGSGTVEIATTGGYSSTFTANNGFTGTTHVKSGNFTINSSTFGNKLKLANNVEFQLNGGSTYEFAAGKELILEGTSKVHQNTNATLTFKGNVSGTGTYFRKGGGTLTFDGTVDLGTFYVEDNETTNKFNGNTTIGTLTAKVANNDKTVSKYVFNGNTTIGTLTASGGTFVSNGNTTIGTLTASGGTFDYEAGAHTVTTLDMANGGSATSTVTLKKNETAGKEVVLTASTLWLHSAATLNIEEGATLKLGTNGIVNIKGAAGSTASAVSSSNTANGAKYLISGTDQNGGDSAAFTISNAEVTIASGSDQTIGNALNNSSLINDGGTAQTSTGKVIANNQANSFVDVKAITGSIELMNLVNGGVQNLEVAAGKSVVATDTNSAKATVSVSGQATFGADATLSANLTLASNAKLVSVGEGGLNLGNSALTFGRDIKLGDGFGEKLQALTEGTLDKLVLFTNVSDLTLNDAAVEAALMSARDSGTTSVATADASAVFDVVADKYTINFAQNQVFLSAMPVPEPTSSMLGLVGLVALTFRRRRK